MSHKTVATVAFIFLTLVVSTAASFAQSPSCTAPPTAPANAAASVTSPGNSQIAALVTIQWLAAAPGPNAATSYVVEVGDAPGVTNISEFDTGETALSTVQPAAVGTYYVRVRSVNACGKSAPSPEPAVTVTNSISFGEAGARLTTAFYGDDGEGYAVVVGVVRGAWGARPTPFVKIDSHFRDSAGTEIGTAFGYAYGRSRRLASTRVIDDSTLGSGETGCYVIFSDVPISSVARVFVTTSWDTAAVEPLRGNVVMQGVQTGTGTLGEVRVQGQVRNSGSVTTYFNEVMIALHDTDNDIIHCDYTFVRGSRLQLPSGVVTDSALAPNQVGDYLNFHPIDAKYLGRTVTWTAWEEADSAGTATATAVTRWQDVVSSALEDIPVVSRAQRARTRTDAIERLKLSLMQAPAFVSKQPGAQDEIPRQARRK
ncbi:MAG TPA: fibronectin type III domain-containing protein [Vicinamibacterales bacterium]|nr:fibronectin type III domain-containing protein [Vicinamibacterales bacterium]